MEHHTRRPRLLSPVILEDSDPCDRLPTELLLMLYQHESYPGTIRRPEKCFSFIRVHAKRHSWPGAKFFSGFEKSLRNNSLGVSVFDGCLEDEFCTQVSQRASGL